jgi:leucyl/phenylalanyl-tRNA--protein transferase
MFRRQQMEQLTPELLLAAYSNGIFPMADEDSDCEISWYSPAERGVLPLESFHVPHDLSRLIRKRQFEVTIDRDFEAVMRGCADRDSTWISEKLVAAYVELHEAGHAHSVECRQEGRLVGGLYGVRLGGAFFGESMFHRVRDASKVALVHLVERLKLGGFVLLDTQFVTPHLERFGATEIGRDEYLRRLANALHIDATW